MLVSERNVDDAVVSEDAQGIEDRHFLSASGSASRHEDTCVLAGKSTGFPETAGRVPEGLPLGGMVAESSGNAEEEGVVGGEDFRSDDRVVRFRRSVHLLEDRFCEGFGDSVEWENQRWIQTKGACGDSNALVYCRVPSCRFQTSLDGLGN